MIEDHTCFSIFPKLKSKRLVLNNISHENAKDFSEFAWRDGKPVKPEGIPELIQLNEDRYAEKTTINWGIFLGSKLIGAIGFYRGFENMIGEVGYVLNEKYRNKGITSEALKLVLDFGFNELELEEIRAYTEEKNEPSVRLLEKYGFVNSKEKLRIYTIFKLTNPT